MAGREKRILKLIYFLILLLAFLLGLNLFMGISQAETKKTHCSYSYWNITAYTKGEPGVGTKTASGKKVNVQYLACPKQYKFGTTFEFLGKKYWCYDRGGMINMKTRRLDIFLTSRSAVRRWGIKKKIKVKICQ